MIARYLLNARLKFDLKHSTALGLFDMTEFHRRWVLWEVKGTIVSKASVPFVVYLGFEVNEDTVVHTRSDSDRGVRTIIIS